MTTIKILAANAAATEAQGRPSAAGLEAVRDDFALRTPTEYGGAWADPVTVARRLAELGRACPSTSWNVGTSAVAKTLAARALSDPGEVFADPRAQFCGTGVPSGTVRDGRLNGRWASVSGCEDAAFALLGVMDGETFSVAVVPVADLTVERTWDMAGMRGTGSHTLVAEDVRAGLVAPVTIPGRLDDQLFFGLTVLGPVVGAAQGALDAVRDMFASDRKPYMTAYSSMGESAGARHWLAEATGLVQRAHARMIAVAEAADDAGPEDGPRLQYEMAEISCDCRSAVELLLDLGGTSGFKSSSDLQRFWRDVAVGGRHPHLNAYLATERYGTALT